MCIAELLNVYVYFLCSVEPVVTEWMEIEPDIGAPLATKDSTKNLPEPNAKENDSGADVEQKTDVINKITPTHVKCDVCNR